MSDALHQSHFGSLAHPPHFGLIKVTPKAVLELHFAEMQVEFRRKPRGRCATCHLRRVLYRIAALMASGHGETEARCLTCWGA